MSPAPTPTDSTLNRCPQIVRQRNCSPFALLIPPALMASSCNLKSGTHPRRLFRGVLYTVFNTGWARMCPTQACPARDEAHRKHHKLSADTQGSTASCECSPWCTEQQGNSKGSADGHLGQGGRARCCISKAQHFALHRVKPSVCIHLGHIHQINFNSFFWRGWGAQVGIFVLTLPKACPSATS